MGTGINTANAVKDHFEKGYDMLPAKYQVAFRDQIMEACCWKSVTFHNKKNGTHRINPLEISVIEKHFTNHDINPWTGERISA